jgi:hypothetical protein
MRTIPDSVRRVMSTRLSPPVAPFSSRPAGQARSMALLAASFVARTRPFSVPGAEWSGASQPRRAVRIARSWSGWARRLPCPMLSLPRDRSAAGADSFMFSPGVHERAILTG